MEQAPEPGYLNLNSVASSPQSLVALRPLMLLPQVNNTLTLGCIDEPLDNANGSLSRSLFSIVWGCLLTIFASVWVSVHPNVPAPGRKGFWTVTESVKLMLVALAAPEVVLSFALWQFIYARTSYQAHRTSPDSLSMTHAFFFSMGGFIDADGKVIATEDQLNEPGVLEAIAAVKQADIEDKSKGDAFTKSIALLQGLWFLLQMIGRVVQGLPVTQLEVATMGFAALTPIVWLLWWHKPLGVQKPIVLQVHLKTPSTSARGDTLSKEDAHQTKLWAKRLAERLDGILLGQYQVPTGGFVPTFWSQNITSRDRELTWQPFSLMQFSLLTQAVFGLIFGGLHCAAWNIHFPSVIEKWLWRSCAISVSLGPTIFMGVLNIFHFSRDIHSSTYALLVLGPLRLGSIASIILYVFIRLALAILMFTSLRAIPIGAFLSVDWTGFIPHFL
ncbi:unnamed protein product [Mycena citricolor]|uniref:Uncharacterized protein n=1 Tax=Mycena citricolor TaxID=2018698 RepID=A0AAD2HNQ7_9AGAR|nr:unnamed protein product [Mycena citricolor]